MIERVDSIAKRENAIVAINGSFFESRRTPHLPVGILIADGAVINKSLLNRTAMGITNSGDIIFGIPKIKGEVLIPVTKKRFEIWGVNRPRKQDEVILYTPEYGKTSKTNKWGKEVIVSKGKVVAHSIGNSEIPADGCVLSFHGRSRKLIEKLRVGSDIVITFGLNEDWEMVDHAITGGPLLLKDSKVMVKRSVIAEKFGGLILKPTARTAVGKDKSGRLLLFVVDKRRGISIGVTFSELAGIMREEGAVEGMALDGGGTSTMVIDGEIKNYPMYGYPVGVSNALIVEKAGYKYIARKPLSKPKPQPQPESQPISIKKVKAEVKEAVPEWAVLFEATTEAEAKDALIDIYEKLILPMFVTWEVEGLSGNQVIRD